MKIRNKLTLLFTFLFAALLFAFAVFTYLSSSETRKEEYFKRLRQQATTKAKLLLEVKIAPNVLQLIYKNAPDALFEEEVAIYDTAFHLLYHDAVQMDKVKETAAMIDEIAAKGGIEFEQGDLQVAGVRYVYNGKKYIVTAAAIDDYGLAKLVNLKYTLIISFSIAILFTFLAGYFFSGKALQPVANMVNQVQDITATQLNHRIPVQNEKDEIGELAVTFNSMLDRLENSFDAQKQFVSNVSHELRTPLSTIITELELALLKERDKEEYKRVIEMALADSRKLVRLSNGLLDLAKASYDQAEISMKEIRIHELLLDARELLLKANATCNIDIAFEREIEDDDYISVKGNEYLLKVAFVNLMENGCKFSANHQCNVTITYQRSSTILRFSDKGIGIEKDNLPYIFDSSYRGNNKQYAEGNGIGLSLTQKIVLLHRGTIAVSSAAGEGTTFTVELPHI